MNRLALAAAMVLAGWGPAGADEPPFRGTVFDLSADIITEADSSSLGAVTFEERDTREFYDPSADEHVPINVYVFRAEYSARAAPVEFQVHHEYGSEAAARAQVDTYAPLLGRLPDALLRLLVEVEIGRATTARSNSSAAEPMRRISIFTDVAEDRIRRGFMEEALFHQGVQVSLDHLANTEGWRDAQRADPTFISTWARDNSLDKDLAETALAYFAAYYRPERISSAARDQILAAVPNRLTFLDAQPLDWSPYTRAAEPVPVLPPVGLVLLAAVLMACGTRRAERP